MAKSTFERKEKKFLISSEQYNSLLPVLMEHMNYDSYCTDGGYSVYNIYYDTDNNDIIRHSLSKPFFKEKLRMRSYTVPQSMDEFVFVELKKKINGIVSKRRATITLGEAYNFIDKGIRPEVSEYIDEQVINEIEYFLSTNEVKPAIYLSYDRIAMFDKANKKFRVTIDTNIQTRRTDVKLEGGPYGEQLLNKNQYLMEVKIDGGMPIWLANKFSELKIVSTSFSKYGTEFKDFIRKPKETEKYERTTA